MNDIAYYNGTITAADDMTVPANDRGFYFGDGIYEAAMVYGHKIFALEEHLDRMESSASMVRIELPAPRERIGEILAGLVLQVDSGCQFLYWQITRGTAPRSHRFPPRAAGNLYVCSKPRKGVEMSDEYRLKSVEDTRFLHCNIKTLNLLVNVLAFQEACDSGCQEAVFVRDGMVTEGAHSNISILRDGVLITHPADNLILPGIERKHLLSYCGELGIPVRERPFALEELKRADEILVTSTSHPSMRVMEVDGDPVGMRDPETVGRLRQMYMRDIGGAEAAGAGERPGGEKRPDIGGKR